MQRVDEASARARRAGERDLGEQAGVETEDDRRDSGQHRDAEPAPDPFAGAERRFIAAKTRPPMSSASASDVAAPAA